MNKKDHLKILWIWKNPYREEPDAQNILVRVDRDLFNPDTGDYIGPIKIYQVGYFGKPGTRYLGDPGYTLWSDYPTSDPTGDLRRIAKLPIPKLGTFKKTWLRYYEKTTRCYQYDLRTLEVGMHAVEILDRVAKTLGDQVDDNFNVLSEQLMEAKTVLLDLKIRAQVVAEILKVQSFPAERTDLSAILTGLTVTSQPIADKTKMVSHKVARSCPEKAMELAQRVARATKKDKITAT